jgi:hypothetical protein
MVCMNEWGTMNSGYERKWTMNSSYKQIMNSDNERTMNSDYEWMDEQSDKWS